MLTSHNVFWCMLEGSQLGVSVLESEGIFAVVGDGVTVTAGRDGVKCISYRTTGIIVEFGPSTSVGHSTVRGALLT